MTADCEELEGHDLLLWFATQQQQKDECSLSFHCALGVLRAGGLLPPTIRPDSDTQDCRWFNPRERTLEACESDGHYACRCWCRNYTGTPDDES